MEKPNDMFSQKSIEELEKILFTFSPPLHTLTADPRPIPSIRLKHKAFSSNITQSKRKTIPAEKSQNQEDNQIRNTQKIVENNEEDINNEISASQKNQDNANCPSNEMEHMEENNESNKLLDEIIKNDPENQEKAKKLRAKKKVEIEEPEKEIPDVKEEPKIETPVVKEEPKEVKEEPKIETPVVKEEPKEVKKEYKTLINGSTLAITGEDVKDEDAKSVISLILDPKHRWEKKIGMKYGEIFTCRVYNILYYFYRIIKMEKLW